MNYRDIWERLHMYIAIKIDEGEWSSPEQALAQVLGHMDELHGEMMQELVRRG